MAMGGGSYGEGARLAIAAHTTVARMLRLREG